MKTIINVLGWVFAVAISVVSLIIITSLVIITGVTITAVGNSVIWVLESILNISKLGWMLYISAAFWVSLPIAAITGGILYFHEDTPEE